MRTLSAIGIASAALMGCSASVGAATDVDAESTTPSTAVIVLERTTQATPAGETVRAGAVARFVHTRWGAVDDHALRTVGAHVELPALGSCAAIASGDDVAARGVDLADVGAVVVEGPAGRAALSPRQVPDPVGRVTGVFYVSPSDVAHVTAPGARVALRVSGSAEVSPFTAQAQAPADLADVRLGAQDLARGAVVLPLVATPSVDLAWEPSDDPRDVVYVDVTGSAGSRSTTRCAFADTGHASLTAALFVVDEGTIAVHRLHREKFAARGIEPGELRFDFARVATYTRR